MSAQLRASLCPERARMEVRQAVRGLGRPANLTSGVSHPGTQPVSGAFNHRNILLFRFPLNTCSSQKNSTQVRAFAQEASCKGMILDSSSPGLSQHPVNRTVAPATKSNTTH